MFSVAVRPQLMVTLQNRFGAVPLSTAAMVLIFGSETVAASDVQAMGSAFAVVGTQNSMSVESATPHASSSFLMTFSHFLFGI